MSFNFYKRGLVNEFFICHRFKLEAKNYFVTTDPTLGKCIKNVYFTNTIYSKIKMTQMFEIRTFSKKSS